MTAKEGEPIASAVKFTNTGNSDARNVLADVVVEVVKNGGDPTFNYWWNHNGYSTGILPKNQSFEEQGVRYVRRRIKESTVLPFSHDEHLAWIEGTAYIAVYARIKYRDIFGVRHWAKRCGWAGYVPPGGVARSFTARKCSDYADVDNN
jgi:hypothetical protein